jgi:hypothetical protein
MHVSIIKEKEIKIKIHLQKKKKERSTHTKNNHFPYSSANFLSSAGRGKVNRLQE